MSRLSHTPRTLTYTHLTAQLAHPTATPVGKAKVDEEDLWCPARNSCHPPSQQRVVSGHTEVGGLDVMVDETLPLGAWGGWVGLAGQGG